MSEPLLSFRDADVGYGGRAVLERASLEVRAGELVGLVGPNGAGKSTLLRVVTGEAQLLGGSLALAGQPLLRLDTRERARIVGVVPQQITAAFSFSAEEFVEMGRHPHLARFRSVTDADREAVSRAMHLTDTAHLAERPVDALSGGDLQRLSLAQALAAGPRLLLLDEPTSHLDLNHKLQVLDLVRELVADGMGVLAVFHDLDLAARYADRIAVVAEATVRPAGLPSDVVDAAMLSDVFGVKAVVGVEPVTGSVTVTPILREGAVARVSRGRVLVVGGSGVAAPLVRTLVLDGWHVSMGALNTGDADATLAEALGLDYAALPAFAPMDDAALRKVQTLASSVDAVVVCEVPFGRGNVGNLAAVVESGRPLVLIGGIEGRDYADGEASRLWERAVAQGAMIAASPHEAQQVLDGLLDR